MQSERFEIDGEDGAWLAERLPLLVIRGVWRLCLMIGQVIVGVMLVVLLIAGIVFIIVSQMNRNAAGGTALLWIALTVLSVALFVLRIKRIAEFFGFRYDNGARQPHSHSGQYGPFT